MIVVSSEKLEKLEDNSLSDCSNIVSVQNIHRLFPSTNVVAELSKASSIRFMKFRAKECVSNKYEMKKIFIIKFLFSMKFEKERSSIMAFFYRLPFASGSVFTESMIDSLLYQTYGKPYLIQLIRLLIGLEQNESSGNLTSVNKFYKKK